MFSVSDFETTSSDDAALAAISCVSDTDASTDHDGDDEVEDDDDGSVTSSKSGNLRRLDTLIQRCDAMFDKLERATTSLIDATDKILAVADVAKTSPAKSEVQSSKQQVSTPTKRVVSNALLCFLYRI